MREPGANQENLEGIGALTVDHALEGVAGAAQGHLVAPSLQRMKGRRVRHKSKELCGATGDEIENRKETNLVPSHVGEILIKFLPAAQKLLVRRPVLVQVAHAPLPDHVVQILRP